jgi:2-polyprenyl-6-methoxyphenol hydroxylase-like FAD-dependent oxidoreductase
MRILVAGAGIGGLTAALALHEAGIDVTVLESAGELRPLGVGINLLPHAVRELSALGLGDALAGIGVATAENVYCDQSGKTLFTEPRGIAGGYGWPQYSVHRGRLQMLLLDAVRERLGPHAVRTGAPVEDFAQDARGVRVRVPDGEVEGDALVGADGLHSKIRALLHPGPDPLLWSGVRMWRGVTETEPFLGGRSMVIVRGEGNAELIAYPIGPEQVNWVALIPVAEAGPLPGDANWNHPGRTEDVLAYLGGWELGWLDVPGLIRHGEPILEYPMVDREPLPWWGKGRVTLLGDAAHPMYPVGANGASQAIVDARVLAAELTGDLPEALARYEKTRREATTAVVSANRDMQRTGDARSPEELARVTETYRHATAPARVPRSGSASPPLR